MKSKTLLLALLGLGGVVFDICPGQQRIINKMELNHMLDAVHNNRIQFATIRPPDSQFATLERRVVITGPPELVKLAATGEVRILDDLVGMLKDPARAWAAEVLLAAMTRREEKLVDTFATSPDQWWESVGRNAESRWGSWLQEVRTKLVWDPIEKVFSVEPTKGH